MNDRAAGMATGFGLAALCVLLLALSASGCDAARRYHESDFDPWFELVVIPRWCASADMVNFRCGRSARSGYPFQCMCDAPRSP